MFPSCNYNTAYKCKTLAKLCYAQYGAMYAWDCVYYNSFLLLVCIVKRFSRIKFWVIFSLTFCPFRSVRIFGMVARKHRTLTLHSACIFPMLLVHFNNSYTYIITQNKHNLTVFEKRIRLPKILVILILTDHPLWTGSDHQWVFVG